MLVMRYESSFDKWLAGLGTIYSNRNLPVESVRCALATKVTFDIEVGLTHATDGKASQAAVAPA
jgi:hypothetical protein